MKEIQVGLIGWGTVGCGLAKILQENREVLAERVGAFLHLKRVVDIDVERPRPVNLPAEVLSTRVEDIFTDDSIQIVVELIGGMEPARTFLIEAMKRGKHVVTANKALLAIHGSELFAVARAQGVTLAFEAAVGGGIPLIRSVREGLVANRINRIYGILNGTVNYILTRMSRAGTTFSEALDEAKAHGFAEADPTLDVEGIDAAHKIAILSSLAYCCEVDFREVYIEGISQIEPLDIQFAGDFGYQIKLLAISRCDDGRVEVRVHPTMLPCEHMLAKVDGVYNAVHISGDAVGDIMLYGLGAGMMPTGSAVVSDLVDVSRSLLAGGTVRLPPLSCDNNTAQPRVLKPMEELVINYYFRFSAVDRPGVLSKIAGILGKHDISIASVIQKGRRAKGSVPLVMMTHEAREKDVRLALAEIDKLKVVTAPTRLIRVENGGVAEENMLETPSH
ncbi:MAG: homoserine dehydrogenase [Deltaproteobacteria bacterium]|nr:homoserine dehydrogenase [Deltaproteobacteria bacterium]MBW2071280.1 homoserine dehydrogenase [Deltaproteobacteria bacterium]